MLYWEYKHVGLHLLKHKTSTNLLINPRIAIVRGNIVEALISMYEHIDDGGTLYANGECGWWKILGILIGNSF